MEAFAGWLSVSGGERVWVAVSRWRVGPGWGVRAFGSSGADSRCIARTTNSRCLVVRMHGWWICDAHRDDRCGMMGLGVVGGW